MRLIRKDTRQIVFQLHPRELAVLQEVLRRYPLVPSDYAKLLRKAPSDAELERQKLLDEALAEQRAELTARVRTMLEDREGFKPVKGGVRWILPRERIEWLLQVFNDIRVGCWILLGAPEEEQLRAIPRNEQTTPLLAAMDVCAVFQSILLECV